jgi:hypothetical protein
VAAVKGDSMQFEVERLRINSKYADFSPSFYKNGLLFVSARHSETGIKHRSTIDDAELLDIYFAAPDSLGVVAAQVICPTQHQAERRPDGDRHCDPALVHHPQ